MAPNNGYASSSLYSADSQSLGYTPFEYWKGPKPVDYTAWKAAPRSPRRLPLGSSAAPQRPRAAAKPRAQSFHPLQPSNLYAAQQLVASLGSDKNDLAARAAQADSAGLGDEKAQAIIRTQAALGLRSPNAPHPAETDHPALRKGSAKGDSSSSNDDEEMAKRFYEDDSPAWWKPRYWGKRVWIGLAVVLAVIIAIVVAVAVTVTRQNSQNRYPDYSTLKYQLVGTYSGASFFDNFDYITGWDPSHGHVHYVPKEQATSLNLTFASSTSAVLKVDTSVGPGDNPNASTGRFSVRLQSKTQYDRGGLFIFDVAHAPFGCGTWPALWLSDPNNWPANGEIDIMEQVNQATSGNMMTLHTSAGCNMGDVKRAMSGAAGNGDCSNSTTGDNAGCGVTGPTSSFGQAFNANGGGIMAVEWRAAGIRMWQFKHGGIPADISDGSPDPSIWSSDTMADFPSTNCDIGSHFRNQSIIVDIDLCGDLTNSLYSSSGCPSNCVDFVSNNPKNFTDAYWEFRSFKVYKALGAF